MDTPAFASSLTISAAVATNSAPPGGCTGPLARSISDSNPCRGTDSSTSGAARLGALRCGLEAFELVAVFTSGVRVALAGALRAEALGAALVSLASFAFPLGMGAFALEAWARLLAGLAFALAGARTFVGFAAATVALRAAVLRGVDR